MGKSIFHLFIWLFCWANSYAQIQRPESTFRQITTANMGYDYNLLAINLGYAYYQPTYKTSALVDITQGTALLGTSNLRMQIGLQTWHGTFNKLNLRTQLAFVYSHSSNKAGNYNGLGLNVQNNIGIQWEKWGLGTDFQYNTFIATHFKHTDFYRQYYYSEVKDGWYKITANNLRMGLYILVSLDKEKSMELNVRGGYQSSGQFDKLIPSFYGVLGINKKF